MNKVFKFFLLFIFIFLTFSCEKKEIVKNENIEIENQIEPNNSDVISDLPLWIPGDYSKVVVVFGHGYETEESQKEVVSVLENYFGLAENKGLIITRTFPKVYFENKKVSADWLRKSIAKDDVFAIITIGAPEKTHFTLADLQDNGFSGKVYSVFPQDNILGTESGSEFVLSYKSLGVKLDESPVYVIDEAKEISTTMAKSYEEEGMFSGDVTKVLIPIIKRLKSVNNKAIPETPSSFVNYLKNNYGEYFPDFTLTPFLDAQTGIKSLNHYVLGIYDE